MAGNTRALVLACTLLLISSATADAPYRFFDWDITYGEISPLGVSQQGILINGQFPGPAIECQTGDNLIINVRNSLPDPFLLSWNGLQHRKNSWQDGVSGTNCPIPPGQNFTYHMQAKDQIGSFFYFPSLAFHKAAGGFGAISIHNRPVIPVPFPSPDDEFTMLIGDWYTTGHKALQNLLDSGKEVPSPDGILINGKRSPNGAGFNVEQGKTYRLRISNVGLQNTLNFLIQDHNMTRECPDPSVPTLIPCYSFLEAENRRPVFPACRRRFLPSDVASDAGRGGDLTGGSGSLVGSGQSVYRLLLRVIV
ncbi:unnamed protein product [Urochloa humidicola]